MMAGVVVSVGCGYLYYVAVERRALRAARRWRGGVSHDHR